MPFGSVLLLFQKDAMTYLHTLETIVTNTIAPAAQATDRDSAFPRAAIQALGKAGLLGLVSAKDVGGMGLGLGEAGGARSREEEIPCVVSRIAERASARRRWSSGKRTAARNHEPSLSPW